MSDMQDRGDYLQMGVIALWIVDPQRRKAYQSSTGQGLDPAINNLSVSGTPISISVEQIFQRLDWMQQTQHP